MSLFFLSALTIISLAYAIWHILLRNFTLKDELWRAQKDRTGMLRFLNRFTNNFARMREVAHARDLIGFYISEVIEAQSLCVYTIVEEDNKLFLQPSSVVGGYPGAHHSIRENASSRTDQYYKIEVTSENLFGKVALEKSSVLASHYAISDPMIKNALADGMVDSVMVVPMTMESRLLGVICAVNSTKKGYYFNEDDLKLFESLSSQASLAHEFLNIYTQLGDHQRISKELEVAEHIQTSLLPETAPEWGDFRIVPFSRPAKEVGGDYYDFVKIDEDRLLVVVADASGKGVPAGMIMTMCRSSLHALAQNFTDLNTLLIDLNTILFDDTDGSHFITMAACLLNRKTNQAEIARAGHTEFLFTAEDGIRTYTPEGTALGMLPGEFVQSFEVIKDDFTESNKLLLFSDGLTEATDREGEEFGIDRLASTWQSCMEKSEDMNSLPDMIVEAVDTFTEYAAPSDDRTLVFIERV